jgi:hypothetical protein
MSTHDTVSHALPAIAYDLAKRIEDVAGERVPFTLIVWTQPQIATVSTLDKLPEDDARQRMAAAVRGMIDYWSDLDVDSDEQP